MSLEDKKLIAIAKEANGDLRKAINMLQGGTPESDVAAKFENLTLAGLSKMSRDERILLAYAGDADQIFAKVWEIVQREKAWEHLDILSNCNHKMNMSIHKTLFLATMLDKMGS